MSESQTHPVLLLVSRRAKPGQEAEFEWRMTEFITVAEAFPGCLGAQQVPPGDEKAVEDTLYHALMAFENVSRRMPGSNQLSAPPASPVLPFISRALR